MTVERHGTSLVIGGTGMLAQATRWLADRSVLTLLVARRASQFMPSDRRYRPLDLDWSGVAFRNDMTRALQETSVTQALLWLHQPEDILSWLLPLISDAVIVLVLGSMDGQPAVPPEAKHLLTVRLGSKQVLGGGRRWLTDQEISEGAIAAFTTGHSQIVGKLSPLM